MTYPKRGEIYWANLDPTIGSEISKIRPVLVVSNDINNEYAATVSILPITSSISKVYPYEVLVLPDESGLTRESKIKANQIRTIAKQRIRQKIGSLSTERNAKCRHCNYDTFRHWVACPEHPIS